MFKDTKAVSPVIGIMLMLVVTVILAAAVSSTSTGMMKSSDPAPTAVFDVKVAKTPSGTMGNSYIVIKEVTGDAIQTKDLKIVTTNPNANGTKIREKLPSQSIDYYYDWGSWGTGTYEGNVPYWNNMALGGFGNNPDVDFGNYTLKPGISMTAQSSVSEHVATWNATAGNYDTPSGIGLMQDMFADWDSISNGDFVNVKIIHIPSGKVIFASNVEVM